MKKHPFAVIFALLLFAGCAGLSKTQLRNVQSFASLLEKNSAIPSSVVSEGIRLKYEIELLNSGTFIDSLVTRKLWISYKGREAAMKKAQKADVTMKIIREYAFALRQLSSPAASDKLKKSSDNLGTQIEKLIGGYNTLEPENPIPEGIGCLISGGIALPGKYFIRGRQGKMLKKIVPSADTLVAVLTVSLARELDNLVLKEWIPALKEDLESRHRNLLSGMNPAGAYTAYFATQYNKEVAVIIGRIDNLEQLTRKTMKASAQIRKAHRQLKENLYKKKKNIEVLSETIDLFYLVEDLYENYKAVMEYQP
jgi:hypothetical protein